MIEIDYVNKFHAIDYKLLQQWNEMKLKALYKERTVLQSKMDVIPNTSKSVIESMKKMMSSLEIYIAHREDLEKASKSAT